MNIGVCAKISVDADARIKIKSDGSGVDIAGEKLVVGDYDEYAVEEAIRTKEAHGGSVTAFTVGAPSDEKLIRSGALALGADKAVLISDDAAQAASPLGIARLLAAAIKEAGCDIVFTGKVSTDEGNSQTAAMVAELLGWAQISQVTEFSVDGGTFTATRNMDAGVRQVVTGSLPGSSCTLAPETLWPSRSRVTHTTRSWLSEMAVALSWVACTQAKRRVASRTSLSTPSPSALALLGLLRFDPSMRSSGGAGVLASSARDCGEGQHDPVCDSTWTSSGVSTTIPSRVVSKSPSSIDFASSGLRARRSISSRTEPVPAR